MQGSEATWQHRTVLLHEAADALVWNPQGTYLDATYGRGGHSREVLARLAPQGRLLAIDRDPEAVAHARSATSGVLDARFAIEHSSFKGLAQVLAERGITQIDGVLMDIGVSSPQIDNPARGFSFRSEGPLDMRMDPTRGFSAAEFLASATEHDIEQVIRHHGEERFAAAIARAVLARRAAGQPLLTTRDLAQLVAGAVRTREAGQDPATRTFQALRIHVNAELDELSQALDAALAHLGPQGRLVVISFHSLEDRIVKRFITQYSREAFDRRVPMATPPAPLLHALGRVKPSVAEVAANPRARSAVMRVAERTAAPWAHAGSPHSGVQP
jgi:16S rRNA (cytosine1402-N4)-methyltransferase